jgi:hypothetical protein
MYTCVGLHTGANYAQIYIVECNSSLIDSYCYWSRCSSVSIVSDYGLDGRGIQVLTPAEAKDFSSNLCVQTGTHPASCTMGTGGPFLGGIARPRRDADHSPYLVPRS